MNAGVPLTSPRRDRLAGELLSNTHCRIYGYLILLSHMKTTLDMDDDLMRRAKQQAAADGVTLRTFVEDALRARMLPANPKRAPFKLTLPVIEGHAPPAVDIADREALYDLMERQ
jgi:hypothetical protein